ncbi:unnamed protein product [Boreogadus saida]
MRRWEEVREEVREDVRGVSLQVGEAGGSVRSAVAAWRFGAAAAVSLDRAVRRCFVWFCAACGFYGGGGGGVAGCGAWALLGCCASACGPRSAGGGARVRGRVRVRPSVTASLRAAVWLSFPGGCFSGLRSRAVGDAAGGCWASVAAAVRRLCESSVRCLVMEEVMVSYVEVRVSGLREAVLGWGACIRAAVRRRFSAACLGGGAAVGEVVVSGVRGLVSVVRVRALAR